MPQEFGLPAMPSRSAVKQNERLDLVTANLADLPEPTVCLARNLYCLHTMFFCQAGTVGVEGRHLLRKTDSKRSPGHLP